MTEQEALELGRNEPGEKGYSRPSSQKNSITEAEGKTGQYGVCVLLQDVTGRKLEEAPRLEFVPHKVLGLIDRFYKEK